MPGDVMETEASGTPSSVRELADTFHERWLATHPVTLGCLVENVHQELRDLDARLIEHTVSAMPVGGPPVLLGLAARTVIADAQAADDYLERLRRSGGWIDQQTDRLRVGAAKGRLPRPPS